MTDEPAKRDMDARGIIEERRRLGELNEENLPVGEKPTSQPVTEQATPNNFKGSSTGLDLKKAEERQDTGRKEVPKKSGAKRHESKAMPSKMLACPQRPPADPISCVSEHKTS